MLSLAAISFLLAAIAVAKRGVAWRLALASCFALLALTTNLAAFGAARGVAITLVLAMAASASLVFVLAPRPRAALPLAGVSTALGVLMVAAHLVRP